MKKRLLGIGLILALTLACALPVKSAPTTENVTYRYDNLPDASATRSAAEYRVASYWSKLDLTYFFINGTDKLSGESEREAVRRAFALWAAQTPLKFTETSDSNRADILIGWAAGEHGDGDAFDGPGDVLAHASYPNPYDERTVFLHFDDAERWVDSDSQNVDLLTVAAHEIGHNLGLDHSADPNALMYPSYSGPHRFLSADDVAGMQSIYGAVSRPPEGPQTPDPNANPPQSPASDADGDGLSDEGEALIIGTDPHNPDTDGDGLSDGVEVVNNMNPLDADMDRDGVSDGQEIARGTNPFFPDQDNSVSPELAAEVSAFLTQVIELQILAYQEGDASIAAVVMAGDILAALERSIAELNAAGRVEIARIDYYESYIHDIRVISDTRIEADTCEVWAVEIYNRSSGALVSQDGPTLLPQTITMEQIGSGWFVTAVNFFAAPAFCGL